ncbi:6-bladed beta-propeller [Roseivirga sp. UBA1976]|uniref:6-bladed beta-propeller n=1 Tax=Roseivirga sp. UBA1976 TaxID=1947386 RepID=UPI0025794D35|nr:6-bladed beta-propeller [Roseivirga sp. UBA1976]MEC7753048.1 6-bladed beta-propeller [Bacteroidota bacterium]
MDVKLSIRVVSIIMIRGAILFSLSFFSCSRNPEERAIEEQTLVDTEVDFLQPVARDSVLIDIHNDSYYDYIPKLDREQYLSNRLFIMGWSGLNVSVTDTTGKFIRQITRRGNGPGEIPVGNYASVWQSVDGGIYVLTSGNAFMLFVYDEEANFRYSLRLFQALPNFFRAPRTSFHFTEKDEDGKFYLTIAVGSTLHSEFTKAYYENTYTIGRFEISEYQQKIISAEAVMPYEVFPEVQESLNEDKIFWFDLYPMFQRIGNKTYLTFSFSDCVYVLNEDFQVEEKIKSKVLSQIKRNKKGSDFLMNTPKDYYDLVYYRNKNAYSNLYITNLQVLDDLVIVQFSKPSDQSDFLPKFPTKQQVNEDRMNYKAFVHRRDRYWLIYNLESGKEELIKLPSEFNTGIFLDQKTMLVEKTFDDMDGFYLMKYSLPEAIGQ